MATKFTFNASFWAEDNETGELDHLVRMDIPAYKEGELAIHKESVVVDGEVIDTDPVVWVVSHIKTGNRLMGMNGWSKKRQALAYAVELQNHSIDWDFEDQDDMLSKNPRETLMSARNKAVEVADATA